MSQIIEATVTAGDVAEVTAKVRALLPDVLLGTRDNGNGSVTISAVFTASTPDDLQRLTTALSADNAQIQAKPPSAPSLSDLVARAKASEASHS